MKRGSEDSSKIADAPAVQEGRPETKVITGNMEDIPSASSRPFAVCLRILSALYKYSIPTLQGR